MHNAISNFRLRIKEVRANHAVYLSLVNNGIPNDVISDLLRVEIVNSVSAMDRFFHDAIVSRVMQLINSGAGILTSKVKGHPLSMDSLLRILELERTGELSNPLLRNDIIRSIESELRLYFKNYAFQQPDKIKEALKYLSAADYKLQDIAARVGLPSEGTVQEKQKYLEQRLKLIADRRNQIVHEADSNLLGERMPISKTEAKETTDFISCFIEATYSFLAETAE